VIQLSVSRDLETAKKHVGRQGGRKDRENNQTLDFQPMFKMFKPKQDIMTQNVLNQLFTLTHVRCCLENLRANENRNAITNMELVLDGLVNSLASDIKNCDPTIKGLFEQELKNVCSYREINKENIEQYLHPELTEGERTRFVELRAKVQSILEQPRK